MTIEGAVYTLFGTPAGGGSLTVNGSSNALVADGAGTDTLSFTNTGTSYWHAGLGTTTATFSAGATNVYLSGAQSDYTVTTVNSTTVKITDTVANRNNVKTLITSGGTYTLVYGSDAAVPTSLSLTGTASNDSFTLNGGSYAVNGEAGTDTVVFSSGETTPDARWAMTENASGQVVINGTAAGYNAPRR